MKTITKWILFTAIISILLAIGGYLGYVGIRRLKKTNVQEEKPLPVTATQIEPKEFIVWGEYIGKLEAIQDVVVTAKVRGEVEKDLIEEGQRVTKGQPLYRLDDDSYRFTMLQAKAALDLAKENLLKIKKFTRPEETRRLKAMSEEAETALKKAVSDAERFDELYQKGAVSLSQKESTDLALSSAKAREEVARENVKQAETGARSEDIAAAEASVRQAEAAYGLAQDTWKETVVNSPITGIIAKKNVFNGDTLEAGMPVAEIVDLSSFKITLGVSASDVAFLKEGETVTIFLLPGEDSYPAVVNYVGVKADNKTGSFPVIIRMENPGIEHSRTFLRAGMDIKVQFVKEKIPSALIVPVSVLLQEIGKTTVFVIEDNIAVRQEVSLGSTAEGKVVIADGLTKEDLLVVVGQRNLREGDKVELTIE